MIDNTIPPVNVQLLQRAEGYTFAPDDDNYPSVFAPNGNRIGGVYDVIPTGWHGQSMIVGTTDVADSALEAAVLLAEAHIEYLKPKTVEHTIRPRWAVLEGEHGVLAVTAYYGDAARLANKLNEQFSNVENHTVVQFTERGTYTFDTKIN